MYHVKYFSTFYSILSAIFKREDRLDVIQTGNLVVPLTLSTGHINRSPEKVYVVDGFLSSTITYLTFFNYFIRSIESIHISEKKIIYNKRAHFFYK